MYKKRVSRVHESSRKPTKKCVMKIKKERKKRLPHKIFCGDRKDFTRLSEEWLNRFVSTLIWDIDSSNNEGTNTLVNGRIGRERMVRRA